MGLSFLLLLCGSLVLNSGPQAWCNPLYLFSHLASLLASSSSSSPCSSSPPPLPSYLLEESQIGWSVRQPSLHDHTSYCFPLINSQTKVTLHILWAPPVFHTLCRTSSGVSEHISYLSTFENMHHVQCFLRAAA